MENALDKLKLEVGIYDNPSKQERPLFELDLLESNIAVFGVPMSGKTNFVKTILVRLHEKCNRNTENIYIIDFNGDLRGYNDLGFICACFDNSNEENIKRIFDKLELTLSERGKRLDGSNFKEYTGDNKPPHITFVLENFNAFLSDKRYFSYQEKLLKLCRNGLSKGITVILTMNDTAGGVNQYISTFRQRISFEMPKEKIAEVFSGKTPILMCNPGRGLANISSSVYEFQCFLPFKNEKEDFGTFKKRFEKEREGFNEIINYFDGDLDANEFKRISKLSSKKLLNLTIEESNLASGFSVPVNHFNWLILPVDVLYSDKDKTQPVGYIMDYIKNVQFLGRHPLFTGGPIEETIPEISKSKIKDVISLCLNVVRQILFIGLKDILVSDYNDTNFAISNGTDEAVIMFDTDSFSWRDYVGEGRTYPGTLSKSYNINTRKDLTELCIESSLAFVFTRLVLEHDYYPFEDGEYRFSRKNLSEIDGISYNFKYNSLPENLKLLFFEVFEKKQTPSISRLLFELKIAYNDNFSSQLYSDVYKEILDKKNQKINEEIKPKEDETTNVVSPPEFVIIKFNPNGGILSSSKKEQQFELNKQYNNLPTPTRNGRIFVHWYKKNGSSITESDLANNSDTELFAEWKLSSGRLFAYIASIVAVCLIIIFAIWFFINTISSPIDMDDEHSGETDKTIAYYANDDNSNNVQNGQGSFYNNEGILIYTGEFLNGLFHGDGEYYFSNGAVFNSTWSNGNHEHIRVESG